MIPRIDHDDRPTEIIESTLSIEAPGPSGFEEVLAKEIFAKENWAEYFIKHATQIWHRPNLEPEVLHRMCAIYLGSKTQIIDGTFGCDTIWKAIEAEIVRPLVCTASHSVYEKTFYRLESAVMDQFFTSARYAFFECIKKSGVQEGFEYWLIVNPDSPRICMNRAKRNPYTFTKAFEQSPKHRNCDCTWTATLKEKFNCI